MSRHGGGGGGLLLQLFGRRGDGTVLTMLRVRFVPSHQQKECNEARQGKAARSHGQFSLLERW